ncbi:MAG: PrsW family glutamic-type intramembrane protease [Parcubacteria group bacterium]|jgi:hypothetical protein
MKILKFFTFGLLSASGALAIELILVALISILFNINIENNYFNSITAFLIIAIILEEFFKLSLLRQLFFTTNEKSVKIYLALIFGSGFSFLEIFSKLIAIPQATLLTVFSWNFFGVFLIHVLTAGVLGCFLARKNGASLALAAQALLLASFLHLGYNLLIIYDQGAIATNTYLMIISIGLYLLKNKLAR